MANSPLKMLAQKAKNRLRNVSQTIKTNDDGKITRAGLTTHEYALIATRVKIEDDPLYPKVTKLLSREPDTPRPIGELIDHEVYDNLPDAEKQRYILNLSSRFLAIKRKFCATTQPAAEK